MSNWKKFICSSVAAFGLLWGSFSSAQSQIPAIKPVKDSDLTDLIQESNQLAVLQETSIQTDEEESLRVYGIKLGMVSSESVLVSAKNQKYRYQLGSETPVVGASFSYIPWQGMYEAGFDLSLEYLTQKGLGESTGDPAQLHALFAEPSLFVQSHWGNYWVPRLGLGWGMAAVFQRGFEDENTSTSQGYGFYTAALGFNINRIRFFHSDLDWSLALEHRGSFGGASSLGMTEMQKTTLGVNLRL